ncbi:unnamed protein product [Moneuplotes crassus]|uniref:Uncharacterized protein n=1 Tax=Euplotes crassus TaxID=5936 RepID=A0AAD1U5Q7_EUPCR|nr:unnamed protein product [Moneuplotes crassus]
MPHVLLHIQGLICECNTRQVNFPSFWHKSGSRTLQLLKAAEFTKRKANIHSFMGLGWESYFSHESITQNWLTNDFNFPDIYCSLKSEYPGEEGKLGV